VEFNAIGECEAAAFRPPINWTNKDVGDKEAHTDDVRHEARRWFSSHVIVSSRTRGAAAVASSQRRIPGRVLYRDLE
jgi:hypothetical protein